MDPQQLTDRVENIWQLLEEGEHKRAREELDLLRKQAPDAHQVVALAAAFLAAEGQADEAIAALEQAFALSENENARYLIDIAEIQLYGLDDPEAAIDTCTRALDVTVEELDLIDAVLLESEAIIALGEDDDRARELLVELDGCAIDDPVILCRAGDLHAMLDDMDKAAGCFQEAIERDDTWADAYHGLGLVEDARGRHQEKVAAWQRVRELDLTLERPPWQLSDGEVEEVVNQALGELPEDVRAHLGNVPIFVEELPDEQLVAEGVDPRLLGLFSGLPLPHQSAIVDGQVPSLDRIYLFTRNIERQSGGPEQFCEELRITVLHETAHFFGLDDDDLEPLGLG